MDGQNKKGLEAVEICFLGIPSTARITVNDCLKKIMKIDHYMQLSDRNPGKIAGVILTSPIEC